MRAALVTGAGQGVGRAVALRLAAGGLAVAVNDVRAEAALTVVDEVRAAGGTAMAAPADVTDHDAVGAMVAAVVAEWGGVHALVNNAGNAGTDPRGFTMAPFWETGPDEWRRFVDVNLYGVLHCCRHALPHMIRAGAGRIVTVVSDAGRVGEPRLEVYAAAKAGAAGFMRSLAKSVGRHGITANSVALGTMWSERWAAVDDAELARRMQPYAIRRPGLPEEAAAMVAHLVSDEAGWTTGQTIPVNGGYSTS